MFKKISIHLTNPVCSCHTGPNIVWGVDTSCPEKPGLKVWCTICSRQLVVPYDKFLAAIVYDKQVSPKSAQELLVSGELFQSGKHIHKDAILCKKN